MTKARRARTDSTAAAVEAFKAAGRRETWPETEVDRMSRPEDQERADAIFARILTARASKDFREHDLILAAQLAVTEVDLAKVQSQLDRFGYMTTNAGKNGNRLSRSPLVDVWQALTNRQIQLIRSLGLSGVGTDLRQVNNAAKLERDAREISNPSNSLLAGYVDEFRV